MNALIYLIGIPLTVYLVVRRLDTAFGVGGNRTLLIATCLLFSVSTYLPSPFIHGQDTELFTHLLGGGVFAGLLWLYFRPAIGQRRWYVELLHLYLIVSALGVANELFELFMLESHLTSEPLNDTSWDLFANTAGVLLFYGCYRVIKYSKRLFLQR